MKQLYICEKCGAQFNTWDEAYACETGHISSFSSAMEPEIAKRLQYASGRSVPSEIIMTEQKDIRNEETGEYETSFVLWTYKLVGRTPQKEVAAITAEYKERKAEEEAYWEAYKARRAAEKAAQESA